MSRPKKIENAIRPTYRKIELNEKDAALMEQMVYNGKTLAEIADYYNVTEKSLQYNLTQYPEVRKRYRQAVNNLLTKASQSLEKTAAGYTYYEKEFKSLLKEPSKEFIKENKEDLIKMLEKDNIDGFISIILQNVIDLENTKDVKVYERYSKPDLGAIRDILRTHASEVWDLEAKHKVIPQMKIVVKVEDEPKYKKEIKPDFVIEPNGAVNA